MSTHSNFRVGSRPHAYFSSHASNSTEGHGYRTTREMGPPPSLDFPPRPMEIDLNSSGSSLSLHSSRTLPNPSPSAPASWDSPIFPSHTFADAYGGANMSKVPQTPSEGHGRVLQQNPLLQWYTGNDGPWIPKDIMDINPDERSQQRYTGNRALSYGSQHRQTVTTDGSTYPYGVPPSDSGYGTRQSIGNTSVYSGDVNDRDIDGQSLIGHPEYHSYPGYEGLTQQIRDPRISDPWNTPTSSPSSQNLSTLVCPTCNKQVKTQSELKKHDLRHRKPFTCKVQGCKRIEGFSTTNDLDRHTKSKHPTVIPESASTKRFRCLVPGCKSKEKLWPRLDNFRSHLRRVHLSQLSNDEKFEEMVKRGEFWENLDFDPDLPIQDVQHHVITAPPVGTSNTIARSSGPNGESPYSRKTGQDSAKTMDGTMFVSTAQRHSLPDRQRHSTVTPLEVFSRSQKVEKAIPLDSVLSAPVGSPIKSSFHPVKSLLQGNVGKPSDISASDATIEEIVKIVLAITKSNETSKDRSTRQVGERNGLPNGKVTTQASSSDGALTANQVSMVTQTGKNMEVHPTSGPILDGSHPEKGALTLEVLKVLNDLGCAPQRGPNTSIKTLNPGSAASHKSENKVTCETCKKFQGRPCELKKHMKRHSKPYGCTFLNCRKTFGSKNDWKRHENSQHFHQESWRCGEGKPDGSTCFKVCYRRQAFQDHLKNDHEMPSDDNIKAKLESCRIGRNVQIRFWCGFCMRLVELKTKGLDTWTERFNHIDDHFMGRRNSPKQGIRDWVPVNSDKPRGDSPHDLPKDSPDFTDASASFSSASFSGESSPESQPAGSTPADAIDVDAQPKKRKRDDSENAESGRPKQVKRSRLTVIYCCQCNLMHSARLDEQCSNCENAHRFCNNCTRETKDPEQPL